MKKIIALVALTVAAFATAALAQSGCSSIVYGNILTPAQWNYCFQQKQDVLGFQPVNRAGDTLIGQIKVAASSSAAAGLNMPAGTAPTSPNPGDIWATSAGLFGYFNSQTVWLSSVPSRLAFVAKGVNFNSAPTDTAIPLALPPGYTRFLVASVRISGASQTITTAKAGLFTGVGGTGVAIVTGGSAITVSTGADGANNNAQAMAINNADTEAYTLGNYPNLYFRVSTAQGAAATADVTINIVPVP